MRNRTSPALVVAGIPTPDYTTHSVTAYAEVSARTGSEVSIRATEGRMLTIDLQAEGFRSVGILRNDDGVSFECDDARSIRSLVGALLGALAAAERAGVIARAEPVTGGMGG